MSHAQDDIRSLPIARQVGQIPSFAARTACAFSNLRCTFDAAAIVSSLLIRNVVFTFSVEVAATLVLPAYRNSETTALPVHPWSEQQWHQETRRFSAEDCRSGDLRRYRSRHIEETHVGAFRRGAERRLEVLPPNLVACLRRPKRRNAALDAF